MRTATPNVVARFWPQRLVDETTHEEGSRDPSGFYLFGLSKAATANTSNPAENDLFFTNLSACLRKFEEHEIKGNDKYYDTVDTYVSLSVIKRTHLLPTPTSATTIIPDPFIWPDGGI